MATIAQMALADVQPEPWKNGGGSTRTLASGNGWRVSLAEVTRAGPFSVFPGMRRHSVVIDGDPLQLVSDAAVVNLFPAAVASYDGALAWRCRLVGGPATVLNLISRNWGMDVTIEVSQCRLELVGGNYRFFLMPVNCALGCEASDGPTEIVPHGHFAAVDQAAWIACTAQEPIPGRRPLFVAIRLRCHAQGPPTTSTCGSKRSAHV